jgi:hypothetical protein
MHALFFLALVGVAERDFQIDDRLQQQQQPVLGSRCVKSTPRLISLSAMSHCETSSVNHDTRLLRSAVIFLHLNLKLRMLLYRSMLFSA